MDRRITIDGFLQAFQDQDRDRPNRPFCFILGAGASKSSGIRTGGELARKFLEDIYQRKNFDEQVPLERWATAENLGIHGFDLGRVADYYPQLYEYRFEVSDTGYAFLEKEMEGREPSYGYSVLAWILANTRTRSS
jgi:protein O-mannosyl-transferase